MNAVSASANIESHRLQSRYFIRQIGTELISILAITSKLINNHKQISGKN